MSLGLREVFGYLMVTGVVISLSALIVPLTLLIGVDLAVGLRTGDSRS